MEFGKTETRLQDIELTDDLKTRLLSHFSTRFAVMKSYRDVLDTSVVRWLKLYNAKAEPKQFTWQSNVFVPYVFSLIQQLVPRIRDSLFGASDFLQAVAHTLSMLHLENSVARWMQMKLRKQRFQAKARDVILDAFKYPIGILKARWIEKDKVVPVVKKYQGVISYPDTEIKKKGDCESDVISYWDFWWDPAGTDERSCADFVQRALRDKSYVKSMIKRGAYLDPGKIPENSYPDDMASVKQDIDIYDTNSQEKQPGKKQLEIMEYWGRFDINGDDIDEDIVLTILNRTVILRVQLNTILGGVKPFTPIKPIKEPGQFTGMPPIKMLESLQNELNTVRNQRIDNRNLQLRKVFRAKRDADIDAIEVFSGPGNVMWLNDMEDIQEFRVADISSTSTMEEESIKQDMQVILGTTDFRGMPDSATGVSIVQSEVASRYQDIMMNIREQMEEHIKLQFAMQRQFNSEAEVFRFTDPDTGEPVFDTITPSDISEEMDVSLVLKAQADTAAKQGMWVNLLNVLGKFPGINQKAFVRSILEAFEVKNLDEIMRPPAPTPGMPVPGNPANPTVPEPLNPTAPASVMPEAPVMSTPGIKASQEAMQQAGIQEPGQ